MTESGKLFNVKYSKMLSFSQVAEALMGLIYHRPLGENFSFDNTTMNSKSSKGCLLHARYLSQLASVDKSDNPCDKISVENKKKDSKPIILLH